MKVLVIFMTSLMAAAAHAENIKPRGQGMPLPWPFPWAKECPVNWASMEGRYELADDSLDQEIEIAMTIVTERGMRLIRLARYSESGRLLSDGVTFVSAEQRVIEMELQPRRKGEVSMKALLKLHYSDWDMGCAENKLVPILTLSKVTTRKKQTEYRLVKIPGGNH